MRRLVLAFLVVFLTSLIGPAWSQSLPAPVPPRPSFAWTLSANGSVIVKNVQDLSFCQVTIYSGATFGSGTITFKSFGDNGQQGQAVSGVADLGNPASPAPTKTTTTSGTWAVPIGGASQFAIVLSGATSPSIKGYVNCNKGTGVVLNSAAGGVGPSGPPGPTGSPGPAGSPGSPAPQPPFAVVQEGIGMATGASSVTCPLPTTDTSGNTLVAILSSGVQTVTATGWTLVGKASNGSTGQIQAYYEAATGSENSFTATFGTNTVWACRVYEIAGARTTDAEATATPSANPNGGAKAPALTPSSGSMVFEAFGYTNVNSLAETWPAISTANWIDCSVPNLTHAAYNNLACGIYKGSGSGSALIPMTLLDTGGYYESPLAALSFSIK